MSPQRDPFLEEGLKRWQESLQPPKRKLAYLQEEVTSFSLREWSVDIEYTLWSEEGEELFRATSYEAIEIWLHENGYKLG
jgi:hypothetical protein